LEKQPGGPLPGDEAADAADVLDAAKYNAPISDSLGFRRDGPAHREAV